MHEVREINDIDALAEYRDVWSRLLVETPGATFFESFDWLAVYWRHFGRKQKLRVLMVMGGLVAAGGVAWLSTPGKEFFAFAQEAWQEAGRVSWPTRKETMQTTAIVFGFVVIMALLLFSIDTTLAWIVKLLTGRGE
jgi:preprotein translocase subunit SecE